MNGPKFCSSLNIDQKGIENNVVHPFNGIACRGSRVLTPSVGGGGERERDQAGTYSNSTVISGIAYASVFKTKILYCHFN